ncbi:MAG: GNAT family N-acetyltransferase [Hyphomicrobiales bacterium]|nr:MAG: GNAT family N-acetyltransferase [Hyphomicrobiales bacterium]
MAPIEGDLALSPLTLDDVDDGLALVSEAGWNQVAADWRYMLTAGHGTGFRDDTGRVVATSIVLPYRPGIGWIGMVLVATTHRNRGLATRLLGHTIDWCRGEALTPMLDATPAGREVYRRLGFSDGEVIERWRGTGNGSATQNDPMDIDLACRIDHAAFGADRRDLIASLAQRDGAPRLQLDGSVLLGRPGRTATQLGPLLAPDPLAASALCERAIDAIAGPLLIDVPRRENALRDLLQSRGFAVERAFTRMSLGTFAPMGDAMRAIAGPELG